jgi:type I restriction enzyme S subunit
MADWQMVSLGEVTQNFDSIRKPVKTTERIAGPYPYYGASGVIDRVEGYLFDGTYLLIAEDGENLRSRSTPIAFLAHGQFWVNNHAHVVQGNGKADTRFLSHLLAVTDIAGYLTGSTQPKLTRAAMDSIRLSVPPIAEQRAIAEVLGALDDKIAANTKLAESADEYVRSALAAVSYDAEQSIILGDLITQRKTLVDPTQVETSIYAGLEHLPRRSMWLRETGTSDEVTSTKTRFEKGDVLFGKLRPYFHKVVAAPQAGICSTDILVAVARDQQLSGFVLAQLASDYVVQATTAASEGTRMPRTSWKDLAAIEVPWPGLESALRFSQQVSEMETAVNAKLEENRTLAATRDTLLPQLMSGKLRVRDIQNTMGEMV